MCQQTYFCEYQRIKNPIIKKPAGCLHFNICTRASYVFKMQYKTYTVNIYNKQRLSKYLDGITGTYTVPEFVKFTIFPFICIRHKFFVSILSTYCLFNLIWNNFESVDCALDLIDGGSVVDGPRGQIPRGRFALIKNQYISLLFLGDYSLEKIHYISLLFLFTSENTRIFVYNIIYFKEQYSKHLTYTPT